MTEEDRPAKRAIQSERLDATAHLAGHLAHDFNNLLTAILLNADLLESRLEKDTALAPLAANIREAAESAAGITKRLAAFGGRAALDIDTIDLNAVIAGLEPAARLALGAKIALTLAFAPNAMARTDANVLGTSLLYLVANAREAMPDGGKLTITTETATLDPRAAGEKGLPPGRFVTVALTDSGTGMTAEIAARAFEPFVTTKPREIGRGFGLSLVYGLARQCGGHAEISTDPGAGTTVTIYLPTAA